MFQIEKMNFYPNLLMSVNKKKYRKVIKLRLRGNKNYSPYDNDNYFD